MEPRPPTRGIVATAATLSAVASLLHWLTTDTITHAWTVDAVVSLVAGAGLMALAIALLARPWRGLGARAVYLAGAAAAVVAVAAFLVPVLVAPPSAGHAHDAPGEQIATMDAFRLTVEVALVGILLWMTRLTGRPTPEVSGRLP